MGGETRAGTPPGHPALELPFSPQPCRIRRRRRVRYNNPMPDPDRAGVIAPPPLIYAGAFGVAWAIDRVWPLTLLPEAAAGWLGWTLIAAGLAVLVLGFLALERAGTPVNPFRPTTVLVTTGPYRYSRNPLYLALILAYLGAAVFANTLWPLVLLPALLLLMHRGVIAREERYLERRFGDDYRLYKARVRRWL